MTFVMAMIVVKTDPMKLLSYAKGGIATKLAQDILNVVMVWGTSLGHISWSYYEGWILEMQFYDIFISFKKMCSAMGSMWRLSGV